MDAVQEARELIENRLADLDDEKGTLERVLAQLGGSKSANGTKPRGRASVGRRRSQATSRRRSSRKAKPGQRRDEVLADITANPSTTATEVAKRIGVAAPQVHGIVAKLTANGAVAKKGKTLSAG